MGGSTDFTLCVKCRGVKKLCGLTYCPLLVKSKVALTLGKVSLKRVMDGSSPPSVYIGWLHYPRVVAAFVLPPIRGDTSHYDKPELWLSNYELNELLTMRLVMVRGAREVINVDLNNRYVGLLQEVALSEKPVDIELRLKRPPVPKLEFDEVSTPQGPLVPLEGITVGSNPYFGRYVDKVFSDLDMNARRAVAYLYTSGVEVSRIIRVFSVGGLGRFRRLVPTRWSITAVDKIISDELVRRIKEYESIDKVLVFKYRIFDNAFMAVLIPSNTWWFEWMEAWFPGSTWNRFGSKVVIEGDWEGPQGRSTYPDIGGCYYASRLAVAEYLNRVRRKAIAVLMREIYSGFNLPIGVWFVRESLRLMFKTKPLILESVNDVVKVMTKFFRVSPSTWISKSSILRKFALIKPLTKYK